MGRTPGYFSTPARLELKDALSRSVRNDNRRDIATPTTGHPVGGALPRGSFDRGVRRPNRRSPHAHLAAWQKPDSLPHSSGLHGQHPRSGVWMGHPGVSNRRQTPTKSGDRVRTFAPPLVSLPDSQMDHSKGEPANYSRGLLEIPMLGRSGCCLLPGSQSNAAPREKTVIRIASGDSGHRERIRIPELET